MSQPTQTGDSGTAIVCAKLTAMDQRLNDHIQSAKEGREDIKAVRERLERGDGMFSEVKAALAKIETALTHLVEGHNKHGQSIAALEASENMRKGERGVFKALFNSKAVAWLVAGALAAFGAFKEFVK